MAKKAHPDYVYKVRQTRGGLLGMFPFKAVSVGVHLDGKFIGSIVLPRCLIQNGRKGDEVIFESIVTERAG